MPGRHEIICTLYVITRTASLALVATLSACTETAREQDTSTILFDGESLDGWDTYLGVPHGESGEPIGLNTDPYDVFSVVQEDGMPAIRISGQIGGGLSTVEEFENYHLTLQFKWGEAEWWPERELKDSGLLYHAGGPHGADYGFWMRSQELQIQEGDCGDYWGIAGSMADIPSLPDSGEGYVYDPNGDLRTFSVDNEFGRRCRRSYDAELPHGEWNRLDLYTNAGTAVHVVNSVSNLAIYNSRKRDPEGENPLTRGKIQLQSEGAELFFRDIRIRHIDDASDVPLALRQL
jgi:hypothetical protein